MRVNITTARSRLVGARFIRAAIAGLVLARKIAAPVRPSPIRRTALKGKFGIFDWMTKWDLMVGIFVFSSRFDNSEQSVRLITDSCSEIKLTIKKE